MKTEKEKILERIDEYICNASEFSVCIENQASPIFDEAFELTLAGLICDHRKDRERAEQTALRWMLQNYSFVSSCVYSALVLSKHIQIAIEGIEREVEHLKQLEA